MVQIRKNAKSNASVCKLPLSFRFLVDYRYVMRAVVVMDMVYRCRRQRVGWLVALAMLLAPSWVFAAPRADLAGTIWDAAAQSAGVADPLLLYAIALVESGYLADGGFYRPYPWTVRLPGGTVLPGSEAEARRIVRLLPPGTNADIGVMQVNLAAHHDMVARPEDLVEPAQNIFVAARILAEALDSAPLDLELGIGRYHSWDEQRARTYGRRVLALYLSLACSAQGRDGLSGRAP